MVCCLTTVARAQSRNISDEDRIWLARVLVAELDWSTGDDAAAIAHLLARRARLRGTTLAQTIRSYSTPFRSRLPRTERSRWLRALPWGELPVGFTFGNDGVNFERMQSAWARTRRLVERFASGEVADPCPSADHFGGPMDHTGAVRAGYRRVCTQIRGSFFYEVMPRRPVFVPSSGGVLSARLASGRTR